MRNVATLCSAAVLLGAPCVLAHDEAPLPEDWQQDSVFYLMFVRSFADSTEGPLAGDGIGDFRGIIERLDYLNDGDPSTNTDLGVTGIWMMPFHACTSYHGYDIVDYKSINPEYGTMDDYRAFKEACDERGIRIVVDLVANHTSLEHPWFLEAQDPSSPKHDWYVWREDKPEWKGPWGQPVWHDHAREKTGQYYYGCFWHGMPDLNYRNPEVVAAMESVADFWLHDVGVAGFRLDAIRHLIEDGDVQSSTPETLAWCQGFNDYVESSKHNAWVVGEVWSSPESIRDYIVGAGEGDRPKLDSCFDFPAAYAIVEGVRDSNAARIRDDLERSWRYYQDRAATFLTNHDMDRSTSRWGNDEGMARAAITLLMTTPGIPFIYYGEEIGMQGAGPHERLRTPMQWTRDPETVGFTTGEVWEPVGPDPETINVASQQQDPGSLWSLYRDLIHLRNDTPALRRGVFELVDTGTDQLVAFLRETPPDGDEGGQRVLVVVNPTGAHVRGAAIPADQIGMTAETTATERLHGRDMPPASDGAWRLAIIPPRTGYVIELTEAE